MKRALLFIVFGAGLLSGYAQTQSTTTTTTVKKPDTIINGYPVKNRVSTTTVTTRTDSIKKVKEISVTIGGTDNGIGVDTKKWKGQKTDSLKNRGRAPGGFFSLTFTRFDIGFSKLVDNGSFTLSPANQFLAYRSGKTSNVGFDILQLGYRFNSNFRMYVAGGFDWNHIRLEKNITIKRNAPILDYDTQTVDFDKNRFSSTYIRIPAALDFRSKNDRRGKSFHVIVGPEAGFLMGGKVKQVSDQNGKQKFKDDYHFSEFRYGAYARIGYGGAGLFYKQYFNDMFENSPAQKGLKNMAFGLMFGF